MRHENYANCASGTAHNDGDKILEAVRAQQRERLQQSYGKGIGVPMTARQETIEQLAQVRGERRCSKKS